MTGLGVIFDMDGVLVDSYDAHLKSWQWMAQEYGLAISEEQFARSFGRTSREIIQQLFPGRLNDQQIAEFGQRKEEAYRAILQEHFPEMDGAGELLKRLHDAGFVMAIGSSGPPGNVELVRKNITNGNLISATVNGLEVKHGKPDPQIFLTAAQKLKLAPKNCAVVEDAPVGLEAAQRAGMAAIALVGTADRTVLAQRADLVVDSLHELTPDAVEHVILTAAGRVR